MNIQTLDLTGELPDYMVAVARKNARMLATAMEAIIVEKLVGFKHASNSNDVHDLETTAGLKVEVRTVTDKTLISFEASANVGAGRDGTNRAATQLKLDTIDLWMFCNVSAFPQIVIKSLTAKEVKQFLHTNAKKRLQFSSRKVFDA